jgi:hypothetical protein
MRTKQERAITWWNPAAKTRPVLDLSSFVPFVYCLLRIRLKHQNPVLSYVWEREREKIHCKCTMLCTVHFTISLFNVGNVLLCVIYQLNFTLFVYVIRILCYIYCSVLSAVLHNCGRSWNVLLADTGALLYIYVPSSAVVFLTQPVVSFA